MNFQGKTPSTWKGIRLHAGSNGDVQSERLVSNIHLVAYYDQTASLPIGPVLFGYYIALAL